MSDGTPTPDRDPWGSNYRPTTRPGHRLPHARLGSDGKRASTHDLIDTKAGFVLMANAKGRSWCETAGRAAADLGVALRAERVAPDGDSLDTDRSWYELS